MSVEYETLRRLAQNINAHLNRVEQQVALISQHLGLPYEIAGDAVPQAVVDLAHAGKRLEAIKLYRELTNADLQEAVQVIDQL
jgi:ribosomal protein L7/L12